MLLPDKMIKYKESVLARFVPVLTFLQANSPIIPERLYSETKCSFTSLSEFIQTLDALYALGKIDIDNSTREIICL